MRSEKDGHQYSLSYSMIYEVSITSLRVLKDIHYTVRKYG